MISKRRYKLIKRNDPIFDFEEFENQGFALSLVIYNDFDKYYYIYLTKLIIEYENLTNITDVNSLVKMFGIDDPPLHKLILNRLEEINTLRARIAATAWLDHKAILEFDRHNADICLDVGEMFISLTGGDGRDLTLEFAGAGFHGPAITHNVKLLDFLLDAVRQIGYDNYEKDVEEIQRQELLKFRDELLHYEDMGFPDRESYRGWLNSSD